MLGFGRSSQIQAAPSHNGATAGDTGDRRRFELLISAARLKSLVLGEYWGLTGKGNEK